MSGTKPHLPRLLLCLLCLLAPALAARAAAPPFLGLTLEEALLALQDRGLTLVFTSRVVRPDMRVESEPVADDPRGVLDELLGPHGLAVRGGAGGRLVVVPAAQGEAPREAPRGERPPGAGFTVNEAIDVTSRRTRIAGEELSQLALDRETVLSLPHLGDDVLRGLTLMPGTAGNDASARFSVRGGREDEVMVRLDGFEIYEAYHLKDYSSALSVVAPETVAGVELLSGGFSAEYGDRMSGVLNVVTLDPSARRTRLGLSVLNVRGQGSGTFRDGRGSWLASLRGGSLELPFRIAEEEDNPRFWDVFAKVERQLGEGQSLRGNLLLSGDRLDFVEQNEDEVLESFRTSYGNSYAWLTHQLFRRRGLFVESRASASRVVRDRRGEENFEDVERTLRDERDLDALAAAQDWAWQAGPSHALKWGVDVRFLHVDYDYESSRTFDDTISRLLGQERVATTLFRTGQSGEQTGAYVAGRWELERLTAELGLRFDRNTVLDDDHHLSPRLHLACAAGAKSRLFAAWGHYYQSQRLYELQVEDGETSFSPSERAEHTSVGFEHTFGAAGGEDRRPLALRAELYQRRIRDPRARWENLFEPVSKIPELEPDRVRIAPESSLARGLEIFLSGGAGRRVDWFLSYTLSSVEDRLGGRDVPRSIDQPHALQMDFDVRAPWKLDLNLAVRYHTGWPTTAIGSRPAADGEEPELFLGPLYGERVPDYFRIDLRASRGFRLSRGEIVFFLDVQNLTSRGNVRGFEVDLEGEDGVAVSPNTWGRILPTFGVSWTF